MKNKRNQQVAEISTIQASSGRTKKLHIFNKPALLQCKKKKTGGVNGYSPISHNQPFFRAKHNFRLWKCNGFQVIKKAMDQVAYIKKCSDGSAGPVTKQV